MVLVGGADMVMLKVLPKLFFLMLRKYSQTLIHLSFLKMMDLYFIIGIPLMLVLTNLFSQFQITFQIGLEPYLIAGKHLQIIPLGVKLEQMQLIQ